MAKVKNLEMGESIANNKHIRISKSLFGLSESIVYEPTGSRIHLIQAEYEQAEGGRLAHLMDTPIEKLAREIVEKGLPQTKSIGNYKFEAAVSDDRQFLMMQLFQFADFRYHPVTDVICYEGTAAEEASKLL